MVFEWFVLRRWQGLVWATVLWVPVAAYAVGIPTAPDNRLLGQIGLGYVATTGIASTRNIDSRNRLHYKHQLWRYSGHFNYNYIATNGTVNAERLVVEAEAERYLDRENENYILAAVRYDRNPFDGYRHYMVESIGLGHRFLRAGSMRLKGDLGAGLRQNAYFNDTYGDEPVIRVGLDYLWHISKKSLFTERIHVFEAPTGTLMTSETGLSSPINGHLALKVSEVVDHYTSAPIMYAQTSTFTTINLIYNIG